MSRVYRDGDTVLRGLNAEAFADFQHLASTRFFSAAVERGDIVRTEVVDGVELPDGWAGVLRHERIEVVSYPYEWPFEMLRDAALLQLRLTREAIAEKLITKDASSYNVQFAGTRPVFIDIGSFERLRK
nr:methyltransferase [Actinomycetota bacterium]